MCYRHTLIHVFVAVHADCTCNECKHAIVGLSEFLELRGWNIIWKFE